MPGSKSKRPRSTSASVITPPAAIAGRMLIPTVRICAAVGGPRLRERHSDDRAVVDREREAEANQPDREVGQPRGGARRVRHQDELHEARGNRDQPLATAALPE
jgi:hypothetical protein